MSFNNHHHLRHSSDHGSHQPHRHQQPQTALHHRHHHSDDSFGLPPSPTAVPYSEMDSRATSSAVAGRHHHQSGPAIHQSLVYVYQLPYNVRKSICDLLDADQSWRELGGRYMGFNDTQLALISHALYRGASPTNELLTKWEASNAKVGHLFLYLWQMKHRRAVDHLWPYLTEDMRELYAGQSAAEQRSFPNLVLAAPSSPASVSMMAAVPPRPPPPPHQSPVAQLPVESRIAANPVPEEETSTSTLVDIHQKAAPAVAEHPRGINRTKPELPDPSEYLMKIDDFKISYKELVIATDDFARDNVLGSGGFGTVYVGDWKGTKVAVKKLKGLDNLTQALTELRILNCCRIDNILPLYAVSLDGPEPCLVYQYMPNGSLEDRLLCKNQTAPLTWLQRLKIGEGIARALNFLHTLKGNPFVHGDVKSANILLDAMFEPKLGDFGLARQVVKNSRNENSIYTHCTVTSVNGTSVYLPAEYLRQKILSPAVDVYSYGIVILEMATGRRAYDGKRLLINSVEDEYTKAVASTNQLRTLDHHHPHQSSANGETSATLESLMDKRISHLTQGRHSFNYLLELGRRCAHRTKFKRPIMVQVLEYFNQCRATDRIHQLCDKVIQNRTSVSRANFKNPIELQLWYDFVRKSCGTLSEVVFENFGAQVTKMMEDIGVAGTGSNSTDESTFCLDLLLNSARAINRSSTAADTTGPASSATTGQSTMSKLPDSQIRSTRSDHSIGTSMATTQATVDSSANLSQYFRMMNIDRSHSSPNTSSSNSTNSYQDFGRSSNSKNSEPELAEPITTAVTDQHSTTTPFIPLLTALGFEPAEIDQLIAVEK